MYKTEEERLNDRKRYKQIYREKNKEQIKLYNKEYHIANKEKTKQYKLVNNDKIKEQNKEYRKNNKEKIKEYNKLYINNRYKTDIVFKLKMKMQTSIRQALKYKKHKKTSRTNDILGCSYDELKQYLESKWETWMNWDNYGLYNGELNYGWDIDHIIPISNGISNEDIIRLSHFTNLQPLCSKVNRDIKRNNY
jgi:hypothetical protein